MKVGLIGAGNMAGALARGWGDPVLCSDSGSGRARALAEDLGGRAASSREVAREADLVVLCHKPHQLAAVAGEIAHTVAGTLIVSILGGTSVRTVRQAYPNAAAVLRIEPSTPVEVRRGVLLLAQEESRPDVPETEPRHEHEVITLFERVGWVARVPESLLGAAAATSAVGPAYLALVAEAWAEAGIRHGLKPELAGRLVAETMAGTAELLAARGWDTLAVRREVTSPGGSTARGLDALERGGLRAAFADAMDAVDRAAR
jgi:pyrroline-5-carboxylate reductase